MARTARMPKTEQREWGRGGVTGYAIASEYDEKSDRLLIQFPEMTEEERVFRKALMERTIARRNAQPPLGITSAELIHQARAEMYGDDE